ncbi:hypothetical protein [Streptomyces sp. NPDC002215]|uniref:hypothetical protein n=1 Tax=Streptomyces sp. NPDC002215 TaxID=3154412 RepID=UPI00332F5561
MTSENVAEAQISEAVEPQSARVVDDRLIDELVSRAQAEGLQLTGEGGLLQLQEWSTLLLPELGLVDGRRPAFADVELKA